MSGPDAMTRTEKVDLVEAFLGCMARSDTERLPVTEDFTVETPLAPRLSGQEAMDYVRATAKGTRAVRVLSHIVEGDQVATLSENETADGILPVFAKFTLARGCIRDARVFYDPRVLLGPGHTSR